MGGDTSPPLPPPTTPPPLPPETGLCEGVRERRRGRGRAAAVRNPRGWPVQEGTPRPRHTTPAVVARCCCRRFHPAVVATPDRAVGVGGSRGGGVVQLGCGCRCPCVLSAWLPHPRGPPPIPPCDGPAVTAARVPAEPSLGSAVRCRPCGDGRGHPPPHVDGGNGGSSRWRLAVAAAAAAVAAEAVAVAAAVEAAAARRPLWPTPPRRCRASTMRRTSPLPCRPNTRSTR